MEDQKVDYLKKLQELDDDMKRNVIVVGTILGMGLVLVIWFGYFNGIVNNTNQSAALNTDATSADTVAVAPAPTPSPSPVAQTSGGAQGSGFWSGVMNGLASIGSIFQAPHTYQIKPNSN